MIIFIAPFLGNKILKNHNFTFDSYLIKDEGHTISADILNLTKSFIKKHMT